MARILIVDDDEIVREIVTKILERVGHSVTSFSDPSLVLPVFDAGVIDLIITDLAMPTSGEVFIRTLRGQGVQTPILVMSGHLSTEKAQYLLSLGVQAFIGKPFGLSEFVDKVQALI